MVNGAARIEGIYRYPIKGLSPEPMPGVALGVGATLPADRLYAIENGPSGFDPAAPAHFPKTRFLMLMRNERLATLQTHFDTETHVLTIIADGRETVHGDLRTPEGRLGVEAFFRRFMPAELNGPPKVLSAPDHSFSDNPRKVVSIINLASVAALAEVIGCPIHPLRFRANLYVSGWPAWHEFDLIDTDIAIGAARGRVVKRIVRCAATNVDPDTGVRDLAIPTTLAKTFGHMDCGIYATVTDAGEIAIGDSVAQLAA